MKVYFTATEYIDSLEKRLERKDTTLKILIALIDGLVKKYKIPLDGEHFAAVFLSALERADSMKKSSSK